MQASWENRIVEGFVAEWTHQQGSTILDLPYSHVNAALCYPGLSFATLDKSYAVLVPVDRL